MENYHHLIFEGPELAGKSWIMSQVYNYLEKKYHKSKVRLDGCFWLPSDIGVFGTSSGKKVIKSYLDIFRELKENNLILEKLHISDIVYNRIHRNIEVRYREEEKRLLRLNFKIVLITYPEDEKIIKERIKGRLNIYPHYKRILQTPSWYIKQQREYLKEIKKTNLPYLVVETRQLPDNKLIDNILTWIDEK